MEFDEAAAADVDDVQDDLVALEEGDLPQTTTEPTTAGQPGDPLEMLYKNHPETILDYAEKVMPQIPLQQVPPDQGIPDVDAKVIDPAHRAQPFLTGYEKTKILGFRANQLAQGARPYIAPIPEHITNTIDIAAMELEQRRLPYIIKRPMPNGTFEYWRLADLMII